MDGVVDAAERQPLLYKPAIVLPNSATSTTKRDTPFIDENGKIDFDPQGDVNNPIDWPKSYKNGVTWLLAFMAFTVTFTCISLVPISAHIIASLNSGIDDPPSVILLVTVWELGEACGPLLIAPFSEIYGRARTFSTCNCVFILAVALAACAQSVTTLIFARFLTGLTVAGNVLNPCIVGDMFVPGERGSGMSLVMLAPLLGSAIGPAISGIVAESLGWRSVLWMAVGLAAACEMLFLIFLRETYKVTILKRRAETLRWELGDEGIRCAFDHGDEKKRFWRELRAGVRRPIHMLCSSIVLQIMAFYGMLEFTFYYIMATTLPNFLKEIYSLSPAYIGYCFMSFTIGASLGVLTSNIFLDRIYVALAARRKDSGRAEDRLPFMIAGGALFPFVVALYGWSAYAKWSLWLLLLSVMLLGYLLCGVSIALSAYVVDAFGLYSASAMTSTIIIRCLGGTFLPMAIPPLTNALGLGYGFLLQAVVCLLLLPLPILVLRYGYVWRQESKYTWSR